VRQRWWAELLACGHQAELLRLAEPAVIERKPVATRSSCWPGCSRWPAPGAGGCCDRGRAAVDRAGRRWPPGRAAGLAELLRQAELQAGGHQGELLRLVEPAVIELQPLATRASCCAWSSRR